MKTTELDNIAYNLYIKYINGRLKNKKIEHIKIEEFIDYKRIYEIFYKEANIFLRKGKIIKINEELL